MGYWLCQRYSGKMTSSGTSTTWSGDQTTSIQFKTTQGVKLLKAEVTLVYVGGDEGPHVPEALSYVLGDQTVAMTDFKAENVEIAAGSTLLFTDADGYAYGAAEAAQLSLPAQQPTLPNTPPPTQPMQTHLL